MKNYIGIDLGTTNSAICSYDGHNIRIWKSPEQNDITPSAIYVDKRGNRYYGQKAYNQAPYSPNNSATLFKRFMGTSTKIQLESAHVSMTPEECSAEILKVLYGYLPEEIRNDSETVAVITVPAAFNQMKKDATLQAAQMAGIHHVALMQEPVAAIMSVMRESRQEGIFLVYDLGGGTFDVSIAENCGGKVNLLSHGGIEMCGGRDIDRMIFYQIVVPWLRKTFTLPEDFLANKKYKVFCRIAQWAVERAKMELSSVDTSAIALSEEEARTCDETGEEMYIDIDLTREQMDGFLADIVKETVNASREALTKAGLTSNDLTRIVFIGGPTNYKPLRDKVTFELAVRENIDVNPMTAVAEGASIFAESIDWSSEIHARKNLKEEIKTDLSLSLKYTARTPGDDARIMCFADRDLNGYTITFISDDSGWSSGSVPFRNGMELRLPLYKKGKNTFSVTVLDPYGREQTSGAGKIEITKTLAAIGAIPASHSVGIEVLTKLGGTSILTPLITEGDSLPKKGTVTFKAGQTLKAGTNDSINIKLWEGDISYPITDNRFIGVLKIKGTDIDAGVIPTGAELQCDFEMSDSGNIFMEVSVPCVGAVFHNHNFYSRQEGQINLNDVDSLADQGRQVLNRIETLSKKVDNDQLQEAYKKAEAAACLDSQPQCDPEDVQKASNDLLDAKKIINQTRQENLKMIRQMDLDEIVDLFNKMGRPYAEPAEVQQFEMLVRTAQRALEYDDPNFENILDGLNVKNFEVLLRQDWFLVQCYHKMIQNPENFRDIGHFLALKDQGNAAVQKDNMNLLRQIFLEMLSLYDTKDAGSGMFDFVNIIKG